MALIGGGMLFTHVHTVAPYANVAAGVYITHVVMGLTALGIGAARLLQDAIPKYRRPLGVVFATLMCVESILLITYNEGLPWFIGYGQYQRWAIHANGTVAPYGPIRGELTFDPSNQRMDLYVYDKLKNDPVPVPARQVDMLISQGYNEMTVPLAAVGDGDMAWHFSAVEPALKNISAFCAGGAADRLEDEDGVFRSVGGGFDQTGAAE